MGRLVGYYEQNRKGSWTPLGLPLSDRNQHLRQKSLITGCGGGFQQECGQPYSPVSEWMAMVDLVLKDEGQQLHQDQTRPYGSFHEVQLGFNEHYQAWLHIEGLYYLGETRSVDEFNIFSQMPAERLCLGCGVQSDERFGLMPPQDRGKLFAATLRLMHLVLTDRLKDVTDDEEQIRQALHPLVHNRDGHFLATLSALLLSLLEGKTDCPISGVFGAGKTRAAAAIIAGLITVDPSLKIMILTKENVASQAFAEHIIGLSLPSWIESKIGRLVGFMALHNQTTGTTKLDIPSAHRHDVIGSKQVIIGCGGGFRHECASKYIARSPNGCRKSI